MTAGPLHVNYDRCSPRLKASLVSPVRGSLVVVFIVIALESSAGLGLIFPGETLAVIAGAMAADEFFSPWTAFAVVALAAMLGDLTGYTIGHTQRTGGVGAMVVCAAPI